MRQRVTACSAALALLLGAALASGGCARRQTATTATQSRRSPALASTSAVLADSAAATTEVLARDHEYAEAVRRGDWSAVSALLAPEYFGVGPDFAWDL